MNCMRLLYHCIGSVGQTINVCLISINLLHITSVFPTDFNSVWWQFPWGRYVCNVNIKQQTGLLKVQIDSLPAGGIQEGRK